MGRVVTPGDGGYWVNLDSDALKIWIESHFHNLNKFTEANNIPIAINKELSMNLKRFLEKLVPLPTKDG